MDQLEILWQIFAIFLAAKVLGVLFRWMRQPEVIGELLAGALLGPYALRVFQTHGFVEVFAELGVIILLFQAGLETRMDDLKDVGARAVYVGAAGVVLPFVGGALVGLVLDHPFVESLFMGTILTATSVGITIRVLADLGYVERISAKIILGAAIFDDILGLIILSVVKNLARGAVDWLEVGLLLVEAVLFVLFLVVLGPRFIGHGTRRVAHRLTPARTMEAALLFCLGLSLLAEYIGLAAIVGAFMAGLVLSETSAFSDLAEPFKPIGWFFIPFFFVVMGAHIDARIFLRSDILLATAALSIVAVVSKAIGAYVGAVGSTRQTMHEVAVGMIPRGEVGIVVAGLGLASRAIGRDVYSSAVGMVIVTTVMAPFLIRQVFSRSRA